MIGLGELPGVPVGWAIGSWLLVEPGAPRRPDGAPHQPASWCDDAGAVQALLTDVAGCPLGHADWADEPAFVVLDDEVAPWARALAAR